MVRQVSERRFRRLGQFIRHFIGLAQPVGHRRLNLVPVCDPDHMRKLRFGSVICAAHFRALQLVAQEQAYFEVLFLRTHEEIARFTRKHDRVAGRVDPLRSETGGRFPEPLPGIPQIFTEVAHQRRFRSGPAVVSLARFDPLFAVMALPPAHRLNFPREAPVRIDINLSQPVGDIKIEIRSISALLGEVMFSIRASGGDLMPSNYQTRRCNTSR